MNVIGPEAARAAGKGQGPVVQKVIRISEKDAKILLRYTFLVLSTYK